MLAALARLLKCEVSDLPLGQPYDEAREERMSHAAETFDETTGRSQPLLPRKDTHR